MTPDQTAPYGTDTMNPDQTANGVNSRKPDQSALRVPNCIGR